MKKYLLLPNLLLLGVSCGNDGPPMYTVYTTSCTTEESEEETTITCEDGSVSIIPHPKDGADGQDGTPGQDGEDGAEGANGLSCAVSQVLGGAIISCEDGSTALISDGEKGEDGEQGTQGEVGPSGADGAPAEGITLSEVVRLCYPHQTGYREVLLRLSDGSLLAHYSNGTMQFLTVIGPGSYITTHGSPTCSFTVDADLTVVDQYGSIWEQ